MRTVTVARAVFRVWLSSPRSCFNSASKSALVRLFSLVMWVLYPIKRPSARQLASKLSIVTKYTMSCSYSEKQPSWMFHIVSLIVVDNLSDLHLRCEVSDQPTGKSPRQGCNPCVEGTKQEQLSHALTTGSVYR